MSATFMAVTSSVKTTEMAIATSGIYLASAIGMLVGIAASSAVQLGSLRVLLESSLANFEGSKDVSVHSRFSSLSSKAII